MKARNLTWITTSIAAITPQRPLTPLENVAEWRARLTRQYHIPVVGAIQK